MKDILAAILGGTDILRSVYLDPAAPPAFLLDSNRLKGTLAPRPGQFDNRWVIFPQDMPSGTFVRSQQVERALLLQAGRGTADNDLAHVFLRWREAGVGLWVKDSNSPEAAQELAVRRPSEFKMRYLALMFLFLGLRRSNVGGFGSIVPTPSSGGG